MKHDTLVIGVPAYNEGEWIAATIQSLQRQDWTDFRVLIADNASGDETERVCRETMDDRFWYVRHSENRGSAFNFNYLLDATQSPFFMWLGAHDLLSPDFIGTHLQALKAKPECSLSYSPTLWMGRDGKVHRETDPSRLSSISGSPMGRYLRSVLMLYECTPINNMIRRSALGQTRLCNVTACDHVILSELLFNGTANKEAVPRYYRRDLGVVGRMERLAGADVPRSLAATADLYLSSFDRLKLSEETEGMKIILREKFGHPAPACLSERGIKRGQQTEKQTCPTM